MRYIIIILVLFMASCSTEKNLKKAIERHGAKESAAYFSLNYPEYLEPRQIIIDTTIFDTILVTVPEYTFDTIYIGTGEFHYTDNRLRFDAKDGKVSYKIRESKTLAPVELPVYIERDCPPCPTQSVVNEVKSQLDKKDIEIAKLQRKSTFQQIRDVWFWVSLALILAGAAFKFRRFLSV